MKKIILILTALLLFTGCNEGETEQQNDLITENATLHAYNTIVFVGNPCLFIIESESNQMFFPSKKTDLQGLDDLFEFESRIIADIHEIVSINVKITYRLTDEKNYWCGTNMGLMHQEMTIIEIVAIEKI